MFWLLQAFGPHGSREELSENRLLKLDDFRDAYRQHYSMPVSVLRGITQQIVGNITVSFQKSSDRNKRLHPLDHYYKRILSH